MNYTLQVVITGLSSLTHGVCDTHIWPISHTHTHINWQGAGCNFTPCEYGLVFKWVFIVVWYGLKKIVIGMWMRPYMEWHCKHASRMDTCDLTTGFRTVTTLQVTMTCSHPEHTRTHQIQKWSSELKSACKSWCYDLRNSLQ